MKRLILVAASVLAFSCAPALAWTDSGGCWHDGPRPLYFPNPAPVYCGPVPAGPPVYVAPPPSVYVGPPVVFVPPPVVSFGIGPRGGVFFGSGY
jgi:hypothetical protein